ncbi:MAG: hypothetical protein ACR2PM_03770 [Hyphomicrobiales bacterium]
MNRNYADMTRSFEAQDLDNSAFRHLDHIGVAYEMLRRYDFIEASARYADNIRALAAKAGAPGKFNATITLAFMSLIAERMATTDHAGYDDFIAKNGDLRSKNVLEKWYSPARLSSELARDMFLLPDIST